DDRGEIDYMAKITVEKPRSLYWRKKIGAFLTHYLKSMDLSREDRNPLAYHLAHFPSNYRLYEHRTGNPHDPTIHTYLYGSRNGYRFRSPEEFYPHAAWL
ncbi:hypothetical protein SISSUDRAFT_963907, partial [Sistotremastrum suecicum HHB10207 ss-3]